MQKKANVKQEIFASGDGLPNENDFYIADLERKIKSESITNDNEIEMDNNINIKEEVNVADISLKNETRYSNKNLEREFNNESVPSNYDFELDSKITIKEEPVISDDGFPNEYFYSKFFVTKIKNEDFKMDNKLECRMQDVTPQNDKNCFSSNLVIQTKIATFTNNVEKMKTEIDCQSKTLSISDIKQKNVNEESDSEKSKAAEGIPSAESPRSNRFHKGCRNKMVCSSDSYWEKKILNNEDNQSNSKTCGTRCSFKSALKLHQQTYEGKKSFKDNIYEHHLNSTGQLNAYVGDKAHKCEICEMSFTRLGNMKRHKLIHEGLMPYICSVCDKRFAQLGNLKTHKLIHEGKKPHKCDVCDKSFTHLGNLKTHKFIHEGKKPHKCGVCDMSFTHLGNLKTHNLIHEGKKPHKCSVCDKSFTKLICLKTHEMIHEGKKPHKCDICDKSFIQLGHLKRHKMIHEGKKSYKCDACDKSFSESGNLKRHVKFIHKP